MEQNDEQRRDEAISKLGEEFGVFYIALENEIIWLTKKWVEYRELYGTKESRIEIMNETAPFTFGLFQEILWENLLLGVSKITDPIETFPMKECKLKESDSCLYKVEALMNDNKNTNQENIQKNSRRNITIKALPNFIKTLEGNTRESKIFVKEINKELAILDLESKFCRDWRNRTISHKDRDLTIKKDGFKPLEIATRQKLRITIKKIQSLLNKVSNRYFGGSIAFDWIQNFQGAISLLNFLESGIRYENELKEKRMNGDWQKDDLKSRI